MSSQFNPSTDQWQAADGNAPQQQFPPQYPQQPVYAQPYPAQQGGGKALPWVIGVLGLLLAAVVGVVAYLGGTGAFQRSSASQEPVVVTEVETQTMQQQAPAQQQDPAPVPEPASAPARHSYGNYAAASSKTSGPFAANVYSAFVAAYNSTGSSNVAVDVYSPVTGVTYTMSCSGGDTVYCVGGNNASVKIW